MTLQVDHVSKNSDEELRELTEVPQNTANLSNQLPLPDDFEYIYQLYSMVDEELQQEPSKSMTLQQINLQLCGEEATPDQTVFTQQHLATILAVCPADLVSCIWSWQDGRYELTVSLVKQTCTTAENCTKLRDSLISIVYKHLLQERMHMPASVLEDLSVDSEAEER